jgi:hypothetical protein
MIIYINDIVMYSKSMKEHATHSKFVLQKLKENKLYANWVKSKFTIRKWTFVLERGSAWPKENWIH